MSNLVRFFTGLVFAVSMAGFCYAEDGPPFEFGPEDDHNIAVIGKNQPILVISVQADDYRILPGDLAGINTTENDKINDIADWFYETSWGETTFDPTIQRDTGNAW